MRDQVCGCLKTRGTGADAARRIPRGCWYRTFRPPSLVDFHLQVSASATRHARAAAASSANCRGSRRGESLSAFPRSTPAAALPPDPAASDPLSAPAPEGAAAAASRARSVCCSGLGCCTRACDACAPWCRGGRAVTGPGWRAARSSRVAQPARAAAPHASVSACSSLPPASRNRVLMSESHSLRTGFAASPASLGGSAVYFIASQTRHRQLDQPARPAV